MANISKLTQDTLLKTEDFIHRYVDLNPREETIAAVYAMSTWVAHQFASIHYLRLLSGGPSTGKTRALKTIGEICANPVFYQNGFSDGALKAKLNEGVTLLIDDCAIKEDSIIGKALDIGTVKGNFLVDASTDKVSHYSVFGPKIIVARQLFSNPAIESRFLTIHMIQKKLRDGFHLPFEEDRFKIQAMELKKDLQSWAERLLAPSSEKYFATIQSHRQFMTVLTGFNFMERREVA